MEDKDLKQNRRLKARKFFFPFSPIKSFRSLRLLFLMAILIALRIVFCFTVIPLKPIGLSISLSWVPVMILGWYFGPVAGLILGMITDSLSFLVMGGGIWFWLYAIQEPIVGLISGLVAGYVRLRRSKEIKRLWIDITISEVVTIGFTVASLIILLLWLSPQDIGHTSEKYVNFYNVYKWIAIAIISVFFVLYEVFFIWKTKQNKVNNQHQLNWIYTSTQVMVLMLIFSFALGPITAVEYYKFMNGGLTPESFIKFGSIFYLVPRVAVEAVKVPIEASVVFGIVTLFDTKVINIVNKINNSWQSK